MRRFLKIKRAFKWHCEDCILQSAAQFIVSGNRWPDDQCSFDCIYPGGTRSRQLGSPIFRVPVPTVSWNVSSTECRTGGRNQDIPWHYRSPGRCASFLPELGCCLSGIQPSLLLSGSRTSARHTLNGFVSFLYHAIFSIFFQLLKKRKLRDHYCYHYRKIICIYKYDFNLHF